MPATTPATATELPAHAPAPNWALDDAIDIVRQSQAFLTGNELAWLIAQRLEAARQAGVDAGLKMAERAIERGHFQ